MQSDNRQVHIPSHKWCLVTWEQKVSPAISQPLPLKPPESSSYISPLPRLSCSLSYPGLFSAVSVDNQLGSGAVFPEVSYLSQQVGSLIKQKKKIHIPNAQSLTKDLHISSSPSRLSKGQQMLHFLGEQKGSSLLSLSDCPCLAKAKLVASKHPSSWNPAEVKGSQGLLSLASLLSSLEGKKNPLQAIIGTSSCKTESTGLDTSDLFVTAWSQQPSHSGNLRHCYSRGTDAQFLVENKAERWHYVEEISQLAS